MEKLFIVRTFWRQNERFGKRFKNEALKTQKQTGRLTRLSSFCNSLYTCLCFQCIKTIIGTLKDLLRGLNWLMVNRFLRLSTMIPSLYLSDSCPPRLVPRGGEQPYDSFGWTSFCRQFVCRHGKSTVNRDSLSCDPSVTLHCHGLCIFGTMAAFFFYRLDPFDCCCLLFTIANVFPLLKLGKH